MENSTQSAGALKAQVSAMMYISESEAPLELLQWPAVHDITGAQQQAADIAGDPEGPLQVISAGEFLQSVRQMADPADMVMVAYADSYEALFAQLDASLKDVQVLKSGTAPIHIFIIGFNQDGCTAIHTTAVET